MGTYTYRWNRVASILLNTSTQINQEGMSSRVNTLAHERYLGPLNCGIGPCGPHSEFDHPYSEEGLVQPR